MLRALNHVNVVGGRCATRRSATQLLGFRGNENKRSLAFLVTRSLVPRARAKFGPAATSVVSYKPLSTTQGEVTKQKPVILRKLGREEELFEIFSRNYGWYTLSFSVHFRSKKTVSEEQMRTVISKLQKRNQALRLTILKENDATYFAEIPDAADFKFVDSTDVETALVDSQYEQFNNQGGLLWRCKLLEPVKTRAGDYEYTCILTLHHAITEGSFLTKAVIPGLLSYLEETFQPEAKDEAIESLPLMPTRESLLYSEDDIKVWEAKGILPEDDYNMTCMIPFAEKIMEKHKPIDPKPGSGLEGFSLSHEETSRLVQNSKRGLVTVGAAVTGGIAIATFQFLTQMEVLHSDRLVYPVEIVAQLGQFLDQPVPGHSNYGGSYSVPLFQPLEITKEHADDTGTASFWKVSRNANKNMQDSIANRGPVVAAMKGDAMFDREKWETLDPETYIEAFCLISNLGKTDILALEKENATVSFSNFSLAEHSTRMFYLSIFTVNGILYFNMSFNRSAIPRQVAKIYLTLIQEQLKRASV